MLRLWFGLLLGTSIGLVGCGGSSNTNVPGTNPIAGSGSNVQAVNAGGGTFNPAGILNGAFTTVIVCVPGTSNCATVNGMLVDTGSTGVRILASALPSGFPLPHQTTGGNPVAECAQFVDGSAWGSVVTADVKMASEVASSVPMQIIADPAFPTIPAACPGPLEQTVTDLGANGILGVGNFRQDCGSACVTSSAPGLYYTCPGSGCVVTTQSLAAQVQHPVAMFSTDNNGVILQLPSVPASGAASNSGSLVFGIGTQSNNALGSATVLTLDANGNFTTTFNGQAFPGSFVDSGSNGLFFLDSTTTHMPMCTTNTEFYCPTSSQGFSVTNTGVNGQSTPVTFTIANADALLSASTTTFLFSNLGAPNPGIFDFGLPFFLGRNVFVAIEGQNTPAGPGPYTAY
ncbi:MAG TPA: DUF3443 domain-containing protein [Terriglobales bacterium]